MWQVLRIDQGCLGEMTLLAFPAAFHSLDPLLNCDVHGLNGTGSCQLNTIVEWQAETSVAVPGAIFVRPVR